MAAPHRRKSSTFVSKNATRTTVTEFFRGAGDVYAGVLLTNKDHEYHLFKSDREPDVIAIVKSWSGQVANNTDKQVTATARSIVPFYNMVADAKEGAVPTRFVLGLALGQRFIPFGHCDITPDK